MTNALTDPALVGRGILLADLCHRLQAGRHVLLVGPAGIGKSALLQHLAAIASGTPFPLTPDEARAARRQSATLTGLTPVLVPDVAPAGRFLETLLQALLSLGALALPGVPPPFRAAACATYSWPEVKRLLPTAAEREAALLESLEALPPHLGGGCLLVLLDGLDRAAPSTARILSALQAHATTAGALRALPPSHTLRTFLATFGRVEVPLLTPDDAATLAATLILRHGVYASDEAHLQRELLRRADGNPAALRAMLHDAAAQKTVTPQSVRDLQGRDDAPFFNMGLVYVFGLASAALARALMIGVTSTDLYIVLTLLTIVGFLVLRVFRAFFSWQPTPEPR